MIEIVIPEPTRSLNELQRMHWAQRKRLRQMYEHEIMAQVAWADRIKRNQFKVVTIERYGMRRLDHDNFVGGCKPLVDALTRTAMIWDDAPDFVAVEYIQKLAKKKDTRTRVVVKG